MCLCGDDGGRAAKLWASEVKASADNGLALASVIECRVHSHLEVSHEVLVIHIFSGGWRWRAVVGVA